MAITLAVPGRSSAEVETDVVAPLEEALASSGGTRIRAVASPGRAELRVGFADQPTARDALEPIRRAVAGAASKLPAGLDTPEVGVLTARPTALLLLDAGDTRSAFDAYELGTHVRERLAARPGVRWVTMCARGAPEIAVAIDAARLGAYGVDAGAALDALQRAPVGPRDTMVSELGGLVIARKGKAEIRLGDVATVSLGAAPGGCEARGGDGRPLVLLEVDVPEADVAGLLTEAAALPAGAALTLLRADADVAVPGGREVAELALGHLAGARQAGRVVAVVDPAGRWSRAQFPPEVVGPAVRLLAEGSGPAASVDRRALAAQLRDAVPPPAPATDAASPATDPDRVSVRVDRERAARLGFKPEVVELAARAATVGVVLPRSGGRPPIRIRLGSGAPTDLAAIQIPVGKKQVPLSSLATLEQAGPPILRADRRRVE